MADFGSGAGFGGGSSYGSSYGGGSADYARGNPYAGNYRAPRPPQQPSNQLSDQDFDQRMRARAMDLVSGKGLPSADQLYAGVAPSIQLGVSQEQGQTARDLAARGLSMSGMQGGAIAAGGREEAQRLAGARMDANQQAQAMRDQSFQQGSDLLFNVEDREQQKRLLDYQEKLRQLAMYQNEPFYQKLGDQFSNAFSGKGSLQGGVQAAEAASPLSWF